MLNPPSGSLRFALGIEYDGSRFFGWQAQSDQRTVQGVLEAALSRVANHKITVICAGRTDTGVHALEQVVHFDTTAERSCFAWVMGGNANLPEDVKIIWAIPALLDFHARYSAIARFYRYIILNRTVNTALQPRQFTWCPLALDEMRMQAAGNYLLGEHDFTSFRAQGCQSKSPNRLIYFLNVYREADKVIMDISANAFLHHMVRNIAGVLMEVGLGKQPIEWTKELLSIRNRKAAGKTAAPNGLYLGGVFYPAHFNIQKHPVFELLPSDASRYEG